MWIFSRKKPMPDNPENGHPWKCKCFDCAIFWDTRRGEEAYKAHQEQQGRK